MAVRRLTSFQRPRRHGTNRLWLCRRAFIVCRFNRCETHLQRPLARFMVDHNPQPLRARQASSWSRNQALGYLKLTHTARPPRRVRVQGGLLQTCRRGFRCQEPRATLVSISVESGTGSGAVPLGQPHGAGCPVPMGIGHHSPSTNVTVARRCAVGDKLLLPRAYPRLVGSGYIFRRTRSMSFDRGWPRVADAA